VDDSDGNIIRLQPDAARKRVSVKVDPQNKLFMGPVCFTCPSCYRETRADLTNMVFRSIDFYCGGCGTFYKLTNPAFTPPAPKPAER
jgi:hypothetical protein